VEAVEDSVPLYESISEAISFGLAASLRSRAVQSVLSVRDNWVLDLGAGPGVSTKLLLRYGFEKTVALDPSIGLLKFAKGNIRGEFHPVVGVSENIPFRPNTFKGILACFSLRDVRNIIASLQQLSVVAAGESRLAIVDIGKPDGLVRRKVVWIYVRFGMPLFARLMVRERIRGNPFRMIIPTFHWLLPNKRLLSVLKREFGPSRLKEFMLGGLVIIESEKQSSTSSDTTRTPEDPSRNVMPAP